MEMKERLFSFSLIDGAIYILETLKINGFSSMLMIHNRLEFKAPAVSEQSFFKNPTNSSCSQRSSPG